MTPTNQAAWLDDAGKPLRIGPAEFPTAGEGELVIRNKALAVNPFSCRIQKTGFLVTHWPCILDCDISGEVYEVGARVNRFKKGDRVAACVTDLFGGGSKYGAFQQFTVAEEKRVAKIPDHTSFAQASVFPVCFNTALVALCAEEGKGFGLPGPSLNPKPLGKTIVVWGGSSSVGLETLQVARAAGITTIATASPCNFELVKSAGASQVLDYHAPSIVDDLVRAVRNAEGHFVGVIDCISDEELSLRSCISMLKNVGGGKLGIVRPEKELELPGNIEVCRIFGFNELTDPFWKDYVTPALENGTLKCLPEPRVVGEGLERLQEALNTLDKGVSATKLVVTL
ncbi:GroES-like protein [Corynespora cassiicola Philippines]|uniref:GroES-like protein n=1 Tax=Corynespora cassiicola Philippines TaxID=1448308 RepID=A0A2T2NTP2_CORCC|nr:GroES-like protein [Corynespora cassiicola Philippines]